VVVVDEEPRRGLTAARVRAFGVSHFSPGLPRSGTSGTRQGLHRSHVWAELREPCGLRCPAVAPPSERPRPRVSGSGPRVRRWQACVARIRSRMSAWQERTSWTLPVAPHPPLAGRRHNGGMVRRDVEQGLIPQGVERNATCCATREGESPVPTGGSDVQPVTCKAIAASAQPPYAWVGRHNAASGRPPASRAREARMHGLNGDVGLHIDLRARHRAGIHPCSTTVHGRC
jgi:hypothetical protein